MPKLKNVIIGIYKITNPKNKIYIGQSTNIKNRFNTYKKHYKHLKSQYRLFNSINKYGVENHKFEIICECSLEELDFLEILYKKFYLMKHDWNQVLFCKVYDAGGGPLSEETKKKISKALTGKTRLKGYKHNEETKKKISKALKGKVKTQQHRENMKRVMTEETKRKLSEAHKGKTSYWKGKNREYKGRISPNKGNIYSEESKKNISKKLTGNLHSAKKVKNIETNMIWNSRTECGKYYNVTSSTIRNWIVEGKNNLISIHGIDITE